ncbi:unnamed protein product [Auanema sp. JU1783]|nr:unnamed protein product [Auanema sp. JU1783]
MSDYLRVEYVNEDDTLAEIAAREITSSSLRKSNAILLALIAIVSYGFNILLAAVIYINESLRNINTYALLGHFACINLADLTFSLFFSLVYVANNSWIFGITWCRIHAAAQEFCLLYMLSSLMFMAIEKAVVSMYYTNEHEHARRQVFFTKKHLAVAAFGFALISALFSIPITFHMIPVQPFKNRFVCGIDSQCPIVFPCLRIIVYITALLVSLVAFISLLRAKPQASIPSQQQDYNAFIDHIRFIHEQKSHGRLVLVIFTFFIITVSPYCVLGLVYEISNSRELQSASHTHINVPQDADTLLTWLKFLFPLISPIIIICACNDIREKIRELFCCSIDSNSYNHHLSSAVVSPQTMTLVGTSNGLQLRAADLMHSPDAYSSHCPVLPLTEEFPPRYEQLDNSPEITSTRQVTTSNVERERAERSRKPKRTKRKLSNGIRVKARNSY